MSVAKKRSEGQRSSVRRDGRRSLLVYLDARLVRDLKKAALDEERHVYEIAEEALGAWLSDRKLAPTEAEKPDP